MKISWSFLILLYSFLLNAQSGDPILLQVGDAQIPVSEFKYIYEKNNGKSADYSKESLEEYLDLYTKFKLKVQKAKSMKLDTLQALVNELKGYRKQLATSYLTDKGVSEELLKELYDRMQYDIEFSHIFISIPKGAVQSIEEDALARIREIQSKLVSGLSFEEAARQYSEDKNTVATGGRMGYFTAKMPDGFYALENAMYTTPIGAVSDVVKSALGYHIIKVTNKRPSRGMVQVAHILLENAEKELADSIYTSLKNGADFRTMAEVYSKDKKTARNGGKLPPFGINTYSNVFEDAAFGLKNKGDISKPISTTSGWHIIMLEEKPQTDTYDVFSRKMKSVVSSDERFKMAKDALISDTKKEIGYTVEKKALQVFRDSLTEDFYSYRWTPALYPDMNICSVGMQSYTLADFVEYCRSNTKDRLRFDKATDLKKAVEILFSAFTDEKVLAYEESRLETKYPEFKSLMKEYEEGILLFEVTKNAVWDKANQDTVGLQEFYELNKEKYKTEPEATVIDVTIMNKSQKEATKIFQEMMKVDDIQTWADKYNKKEKIIIYREMTLRQSDKPLEGLNFEPGAHSALTYDGNSMATSSMYIKAITPAKVKLLNETRGYVVADFQDKLEKDWVKALMAEFPVRVYDDVLKQITK